MKKALYTVCRAVLYVSIAITTACDRTDCPQHERIVYEYRLVEIGNNTTIEPIYSCPE